MRNNFFRYSRNNSSNVWKARRLDPDTLAFGLGLEAIIVSVFIWINPTLLEIIGARLGFDFLESSSAIWGVIGLLLGLTTIFMRSGKVKSKVMLVGVAYWTFLAMSFLLASPSQPIIASGFAISSAALSILAYWRSWVWV